MKLYGYYFDSYEETYGEENSQEEEGCEPKQFKIIGMEYNKLSKWLKSKNDFNEANKLINNIRIDMSNVKVCCKDKKVSNDLNRMITDINNNTIKEENSIKDWKKVYLT